MAEGWKETLELWQVIRKLNDIFNGGLEGQALIKQSNDDFDFGWVNIENLSLTLPADGSPTMQVITASGNVTGGALGATSGATMEAITASGVVENTSGLAENAGNVFLDPTGGNDSYNGLYGVFSSGTNGPKATWAGVAALDLSAKTGIFMLAGETITGELVDVATDFVGTSGTYNTLGAYYLTGSVPLQGLGGGARPIIQGTATRPLDYDGTENLTAAQHFPSFTEGGASASNSSLVDLGMQTAGNPYRKDTAPSRYVKVENLHARHSGGFGFKTDGGSHVTFSNCYAECCAHSGITHQRCADGIVEDCFVTQTGYAKVHYSCATNGACITFNQSDRCIGRRNLQWLNYGEGMSCFASSSGGAYDHLWEDNVSFDIKKLHFYNSDAPECVWRRNLCFQTHRDSVKAGHLYGSFGESFAGLSMQAAEAQEPLEHKTKNCAVYSNIFIWGERALFFQDDYRLINGGNQHDFESMYVFHNTFIQTFNETVTDSGNANPTASDGQWHYNLHLFPADTNGAEDNLHKIRLVGWLDGNQKHNGWTDTQDSQTDGNWTDNIAITDGTDHSYDTTGWDDLQSLGTWDLHNGHGLSLDNAVALVTAVKAKLGVPINAAADVSADAAPGHPAEITIASYDGLDFNGDAWVTNDLGAIKA